jgi:hypothetical protein
MPVCPAGRTFFLARTAAFGQVLELPVVEESLLAGCEDEFSATVHTRQHPVRELHETPFSPISTVNAVA